MAGISIKEIARQAGTSIATVSRVLNTPGHTCHDKTLADRIWKIAADNHYTANAYARSLRSGAGQERAAYSVDVFLTRFDAFEADVFFDELFGCIKTELSKAGCALGDVLHLSDIAAVGSTQSADVHVPYQTSSDIRNASVETSLAMVSQKKSSGLIIIGKCPAHVVDIVTKRYSCVVGIDRNPTDYRYDEVICDGITAATMAVEHLLSFGHTKIAYIGDCTNENRYIGYYNTLLRHQCTLNYSYVFPTDQTRAAAVLAAQKMLQSDNRPTAIFCANDTTALGVMEVLKKSRLKSYAPSIISIDNIEASESTSPMLTTVDIPKKEMAHLAVMLLMDRKAGNHQKPVRMELPCRLMVRDSVRPRK